MPDPRHHGRPEWGGHWSPPRGGWGPGRHMFRRILGFLLFLLLVGAGVGAIIATGLTALSGSGRWAVVALTVIALAGFAMVGRRVFGRTVAPVGELIDATQRLGEGDTGVRLTRLRPGPFAAVFTSFNRMAERLEQEDERRRRLLADIGHELRTPMTVIRGEIEAVIDGVHPPESLANVVDEVALVERLLDDLKVLALAEAGRLQLEADPTDLGALVRDVVNSFSRVCDEQAVAVEVTMDADMPEVEIDSHRMHQVISNLVSNALNQMRHGGVLTVEVASSHESVIVKVADTGPGVPPDQRERIFERFVRAGDTAGTGLGLSISRDLVSAHGGTLAVEDSESGGAVFVVTLPLPDSD